MSWFIDDKTRQEIEAALRHPLPPPTSEEFRTLTQRLATENPDLRQRILEALSASPVELPSERHVRRLNRQAFIRRLLFGWLRRETFAGDVVWDKRRILMSAFGVMAVLLVAMLSVNRTAVQQQVAGPRARQATVQPTVSPTPAAVPTQTPQRPGPATAARTGLLLSGTFPPLSQPSMPAASAPPAAVALSTRAPVRPTFGQPSIPNVPAPPVWPDPPSPPPIEPAASAPRSILQQVAERPTSSRALIVYDAQASATSPSMSAPAQGAMIYDRSSQTAAGAAPGAGTVTPTLRAGQMLAARLVTGLALVPGTGSVPVVAASDDPAATWLGDATMGSDGLAQVTFHTLVREQSSLPLRAIALDATSRRPGLDAPLKTVARNTAASVVNAALRSTSDYVQALLQQRQVSVTNGWATITTGDAPPLWMLFGSRLAEQLTPRSQQDAARPLQVAELSAGTSFTILVLQGGQR